VCSLDVVASIRRFGARDGLGQSLMATTEELSAPDDQRIVFRLKKPFSHLAQALAGGTANVAFINPRPGHSGGRDTEGRGGLVGVAIA
jgi:peptide/nickel transport system substrate-binding protein